MGFTVGTVVRNTPANEGDPKDMGLIPGSGSFPGVFQYSCLEKSMDIRTRWSIVHGVTNN